MYKRQGLGNAITNGLPDGETHRYVCLVVIDIGGEPAWRGTGILIAPTVVLTAGHVTDGGDAARVWFDTDLTENSEYPFGGSTSIEGTPHTHPDFEIGASPTLPDWITHDVGVVILEVAVTDRGFGELPDEGYVDTLSMMTPVDQVGYGVQERVLYDEVPHGPPQWDNPRIRMYAPAQLITSKHKWGDEFIRTTSNPAQGKGGTGFGDSGGPILEGGTDTIIGLTSWGTNYPCKGVSYSSRVDTFDVLEWITSFLT